MITRFRPTREFYSEETQSHYLPKFVYTVHEGNLLLDALSRDWHKKGMVEFVSESETSAKARLAGSGQTFNQE